MRIHQHAIFPACVILVFSCALSAQPTTSPVLITVTDPSGQGIPGVQVRLIPGPVPAPAKDVTDAKGQYAVNLASGGHGLFLSASGFKGDVRHIEVKMSKEVQTFAVRLEIAPNGSPEVIGPPCDPTPNASVRPCEPLIFVSAFPYHDDTNFSASDLKAMPRTTITVHNSHSGADETYSGVRLADILAKVNAPLGDEFRGVAVSSYVEVGGSDGYAALFSLAEINPAFHSGEVILADTMNGKPLDTKQGPFKVVATEDKRPARWVRNVTNIQLKLPN
jgi:hypothetical protein